MVLSGLGKERAVIYGCMHVCAGLVKVVSRECDWRGAWRSGGGRGGGGGGGGGGGSGVGLRGMAGWGFVSSECLQVWG